MDNELTGHNRSLHDQVTRLVFFTYLRMATYKESKVNILECFIASVLLVTSDLQDIELIETRETGKYFMSGRIKKICAKTLFWQSC